MSRTLRITRKARVDLEELAYFIARDSVEAALRFRQAAIQTGKGLLELPEAYPVFEDAPAGVSGLRKRSVEGFPNHLIFYLVNEGSVEIVRFLHGARDLPAALRDGGEVL